MSEYIIDGSDRRSPKAARNASIYEEREAGAKFIEIANKYGLTIERVRQIWRKEQWHRSRFDGLQPIVRCRDCIYFEQNYTDGTYFDETVCWSWDNGHDYPHLTHPDGFCHEGKRRGA